MTAFASAPPAEAPKTGKDFISLPAFPAPGPAILTIVAYSYIPDYVNPFAEEEKPPYPAVELYLGASTDKGVGFVKTYPIRYSLHEKAGYRKLYKFATGNDPKPGSKPDDMIGGGLSATVTNENKTSKKGKDYVKSSAKDFAAVHPKLRGEITQLASLKPALDAILAAQDRGDESTDKSNPF